MGRVVESGTSKPIPDVVVWVFGDNLRNANNNRAPRQILTDADGRFVFRDLPKGPYTINARKAGYIAGYADPGVPGEFGSVVLAEGQHVTDLALPLKKFAAIGGTVLDDSGEPVSGVTVQALRRDFVAGHWRLTPVPPAKTTDDRGMYRLPTLTPGDYVVAALQPQGSAPASVVQAYAEANRSGDRTRSRALLDELSAAKAPMDLPGVANSLRIGDALIGLGPVTPPLPSGDGKLLVYAPAYMPAGPDAAMSLGSGEERSGVDLQLKLTATVRVSGTVTGPGGPLLTALRLTPAGSIDFAADFDAAATVSDASGAFTFLGVQPGTYMLTVLRTSVDVRSQSESGFSFVSGSVMSGSGGTVVNLADQITGRPAMSMDPTLWARQPITAGTTDLDGVAVVVHAGARIRGRLEFDGGAEKPAQLGGLTLGVEPVAGGTRTLSAYGAFDASGNFVTTQLPAGAYFVRMNNPPRGWMVKSVVHGDRDISDAAFELGAEDVTDVVVTLTDRASELAGTVRTDKGAGDGKATVLVFPTDRARWVDYGEHPRRLRSTHATTTGAYSFANLPAGEYCVVAVSETDAQTWQAPARLQALAALSARVTIAGADHKSLDLTRRTP